MADQAELAEARVLLEGVMGEVGERPCPPAALRSACRAARAGIAGGEAPYQELAAAAGLGADALPGDDQELWLALATAVAARPDGAAGELSVSEWLCALAALTLWGPGTQADASSLASCIIEAEAATKGADPTALESAFAPVVQRWRALEALDVTERLTPLGWWGLPLAQRRAWGAGA